MLASELYAADYIHYSAGNAELESLYSIINTTKSQILNNFAKKQLAIRTQAKSQELLATGMDAKNVESLLSGDAFRNLQYAQAVDGGQTNTLANMSIEGALVRLETLPQEINSIQQFINLAEQNVLNYLNKPDAKQLMQDYADYILEQFSQQKGVTPGDIGTQIVSSLLSRSHENFFRVAGKAKNIPTGIAKIIALIRALPEANISGTMAVKHSGSKVQGTTTGESEISRELFNKYNRWVQYLNKMTAESAFAVATLKGNKEILERLREMEVTIEQSGGKNYDVDFKPDAQIRKLYSQIEGGLERATKNKSSKSDVQYAISGNGVTATMGVNVKDYTPKINPDLQSYSFQIQSGTPLFTLLVREAGMTGNQMNNIYNLAAVHGDSKGLNAQWSQLMDCVKYRALLNTLMGITIPEQTFYISINGNMWTMADFINHIINGSSGVIWTEKSNSSGGGLERVTYVRRNVWRSPKSNNAFQANIRSNQLQRKITDIMYSTKIQIDLRLSELATLFKFVL